MIALRKQYYGRDLEIGDHFEAEEKHAPLLERVGAAKRETPEGPREEKRGRYERRDMRAKP